MPPKDENPITPAMGTLYITDLATGEETPLGEVTNISETIVPETISPPSVYRITQIPKATFTMQLTFREMSRKKFVKKLMGNRVPRNTANAVASVVRKRGDSYAWAYMVIGFVGFALWAESLGQKRKKV